MPSRTPAKKAAPAKRPEGFLSDDEANDLAREYAHLLGTTPTGPGDFSERLGLDSQAVTQWRYNKSAGKSTPKPGVPDETWLVSDRRPAYADALTDAFADAYYAARETLTVNYVHVDIEHLTEIDVIEAPAAEETDVEPTEGEPIEGDAPVYDLELQLVEALRPIGDADIAELCGVDRATVYKWQERKLLPEPTWLVSGEKTWAKGVITNWHAHRKHVETEKVRTSTRTQGNAARALVASLKAQGVVEFNEAGTVTVSQSSPVKVTPRNLVALKAIE